VASSKMPRIGSAVPVVCVCVRVCVCACGVCVCACMCVCMWGMCNYTVSIKVVFGGCAVPEKGESKLCIPLTSPF